MVDPMKTTMELPDELLRQVRDYSRATGITMRELVVEGLRSELARRQAPRARADFVFTTADGHGLREGLAPRDVVTSSYEMPAS